MKQLQRMTRLLAAALLLSGLSATMFAQDQEQDKNERDRLANSTTITGCLNKDASGGYTLTDQSTGTKMTVIGAADLEKHSTNHKVSLTGMAKTDATGKSVFEVSKLTHVSNSCKAPDQQ